MRSLRTWEGSLRASARTPRPCPSLRKPSPPACPCMPHDEDTDVDLHHIRRHHRGVVKSPESFRRGPAVWVHTQNLEIKKTTPMPPRGGGQKFGISDPGPAVRPAR